MQLAGACGGGRGVLRHTPQRFREQNFNTHWKNKFNWSLLGSTPHFGIARVDYNSTRVDYNSTRAIRRAHIWGRLNTPALCKMRASPSVPWNFDFASILLLLGCAGTPQIRSGVYESSMAKLLSRFAKFLFIVAWLVLGGVRKIRDN